MGLPFWQLADCSVQFDTDVVMKCWLIKYLSIFYMVLQATAGLTAAVTHLYQSQCLLRMTNNCHRSISRRKCIRDNVWHRPLPTPWTAQWIWPPADTSEHVYIHKSYIKATLSTCSVATLSAYTIQV